MSSTATPDCPELQADRLHKQDKQYKAAHTADSRPLLAAIRSDSTSSCQSNQSVNSDISSSGSLPTPLPTPSTLINPMSNQLDEACGSLGLELTHSPFESPWPQASTSPPRNNSFPPMQSTICSPETHTHIIINTEPRPLRSTPTAELGPFQYPEVRPQRGSVPPPSHSHPFPITNRSRDMRRATPLTIPSGSCHRRIPSSPSTPAILAARSPPSPKSTSTSTSTPSISPLSTTSHLPSPPTRNSRLPRSPIAFAHAPLPTPIPPSLLARRSVSIGSDRNLTADSVIVFRNTADSVGVRLGPANRDREAEKARAGRFHSA